MSGFSHSNQLIREISFSLCLQSCLLGSKVRKKWESTAFPFFKACNATLVLFFIYDLVRLNPRYERKVKHCFTFLKARNLVLFFVYNLVRLNPRHHRTQLVTRYLDTMRRILTTTSSHRWVV